MNDRSARVDALFSRLREMCGDSMQKRLKKMNLESAATSGELADRIRALSAVVLGHQEDDTDEALRLAEEKMSEWLAVENARERLSQMALKRLEEHQEDVWRGVQLRLLREMPGTVSPRALERYAKWCALEKITLGDGYARSRPSAREELVGQDAAWTALLTALATPFPQHIILYGPPGVGKTSSARIALEAAKASGRSRFLPDAPFVEVDGATLRWDERSASDPLVGSVHDPIFQGARSDLGDSGIPEPKPGLVTQAHGGVLFIDEIGEMPALVLGRLLKVLEDRRVRFQSPYFDPADEQIPPDIRKLFSDGAPADFVLIGATTRSPGELPEALRSRCAHAFFRPLTAEQLALVASGVAHRLGASTTAPALREIARASEDGREAMRLVTAAQSLALQGGGRIDAACARNAIKAVKPGAQHEQPGPDAIGRVRALGVRGSVGCVVTLEAAVFDTEGAGDIRFNEAAGDMARDAVCAAMIALRSSLGLCLKSKDVYVNATGGGKVDGPSLGLAAALAIYSAATGTPLKQSVGVTGEISLSGAVLPVGGVEEKCNAARRLCLDTVVIPVNGALPGDKRLTVRRVQSLSEALAWIAGET